MPESTVSEPLISPYSYGLGGFEAEEDGGPGEKLRGSYQSPDTTGTSTAGPGAGVASGVEGGPDGDSTGTRHPGAGAG